MYLSNSCSVWYLIKTQVSVALKLFVNYEISDYVKGTYVLKIEWVRYALSLVRAGGIAF